MSMPPRFEPTCPPDAHKVMRDPENKVIAEICVAIEDSELSFGVNNICDLLSAFSQKPLLLCSNKVRDEILKASEICGITPRFLTLNEDGNKGSIMPAEINAEEIEVADLRNNIEAARNFFDALSKKCIAVINLPSMYILRSISTVYAWDALLAKQFLSQYEKASQALTDADRELLQNVRYGREDALKVKDISETAYAFLRLERKLFLQYPTEDD